MSENPDPMREFQMPYATPGLPILWYRRGTFDRTSVEVAYMIHAGARTAVILSSTGRRLDAVRHISDPKLQLSEEQRENGAWDYTDEHKRSKELEASITKRLESLEIEVAALRSSLVPERSERKERRSPPREVAKTPREVVKTAEPVRPMPQLEEYRALVRQAKEMGIDVPAGATRAEVEEWMERQQQEAVSTE